VTVNGLNPGFTDTPLARAAFTEDDWKKRRGNDPLGRNSMPEDIAQTVLFLAATGGAYMTGQIVTTRMRF
jgi:3-oxoacyl-[acyl-carrier protein] reductase